MLSRENRLAVQQRRLDDECEQVTDGGVQELAGQLAPGQVRHALHLAVQVQLRTEAYKGCTVSTLYKHYKHKLPNAWVHTPCMDGSASNAQLCRQRLQKAVAISNSGFAWLRDSEQQSAGSCTVKQAGRYA